MSSISKYENDIQKYLSGDLTLEKYIDEINSSIFVDLNIGNDFVWSAVTIFVDNKVHTSNIFAKQNDIKSIVTKRSDALNDLIARKKCKSFTNALVSDATINSKYIRLDGQLLKSCVQINENNESINNDDVVFSDSENTTKDCQNSIDRLRKCFSILPNFDVTEFRPFFATYRKFSTDLLGENNDVSFLYFIPSSLYVSRLKILFYICVSSKFVEEKDNIDGLYRSISFLFDKHASAIYVKQLQIEELKRKRESLKSAVSAIMTRNMSHNLGSHYLHYTKTQLEQLAKKGGEFGPDIRGAARVMGYMQGRMEYLATLVSGDRYPYGCVNFKSQIFDELTIDDFSKRHFEIEQGKNVSAIYDRIADIVDEIYENGCNEKIIKQYLPEIYEQSQKAKHDNSHNRTTNFLLTNLIFSEGFTRSNILDGKDADNSIKIHVRYGNEIFTGSSEKTDLERDIKERLSKINIALPGGILSCHAFFNIIENFIRNSAKYHRTTFQKNDNDIQYLTTTIRITEEGDYYKFTIYDNKQNALSVLEIDDKYTTLIESIRDRLRALHILDNDNSVDKNNKGFKEILFSTIWLRAFVYMHEKEEKCPNSYANVLLAIQSALDGDDKMQLIEKYGFKVIAVDDNGDECSIEQHRDENLKANLALQFTLPKYNRNITIDLTKEGNIDSLLNVYGDVVYSDESKLTSLVDKINDNLQKRIKLDKITEEIKVEKDLIFPRSTSMKYANTEIGAIEALKEVLHRRFGEKEFEKYQVIFGNLDVKIKDKYKIFFDRHLSTQKDMALFTKYAYADSISGGNFTITLTEMYNQWVKEGCKEDISEYYTILKIKESALTRITFIDERLYGEMHKQNMETELACRNIRVLNYQEPKSTSKKDDFLKLFIGNKFHRGGNTTHFLSIHLGLVEKIVQESKAFNSMSDESGKRYSEYNLKDRTIKFMDLLKKYFGDKNQKVFISIHSGRGNFSAELDGPLAIYPFIGMTAIENAYSNSKYLLCQLFYSTIYLGKGVANEHKNNQ